MNVIIVDEGFTGALESKLEQAVNKLIEDAKDAGVPMNKLIKLTVFLKTDDENELNEVREELITLNEKYLSKNIPAGTVLSQPPLSGNDVMLEAVFSDDDDIRVERNIFNKHPYVVLASGTKGPRLVISGGLISPGNRDFVFECQRVFDFAEQLLLKEDLDFSHITDQRNYIPEMFDESRYGDEDTVNVGIFDSIRSLYFDPEMFKGKSIPGFTATGTKTGNVTIDFTALAEALPEQEGSEEKNVMPFTGLFTAAQLTDVQERDVEGQARQMINSIAEQTGRENDVTEVTYLRVYLKDGADLPVVKNVIDQNIKAGNIVYLEAPMHDEKMKVYMEAIK